MDAKAFHPVGSLAATQRFVSVYYWSKVGEVDTEWLKSRFPQSPHALYVVFKASFSQYCGPEWCGEDAREEIIDYLEQGSTDLAVFERDGYPPFIEITDIYLIPDHDSIVLQASVPMDGNLDEHGTMTLLTPSGITFGYCGDFDDIMRDTP